MHARRKKQNKKTTKKQKKQHPSENKYTPQQTHAFAQCYFTLITEAASAIGSEDAVQGI